jgi:hypothetical protein
VQRDNAATLALLDTPSNRGAISQKNPWQGSVDSPGQGKSEIYGARVYARNAMLTKDEARLRILARL